MGADLYIKSMSDKARAKWNPVFEAACAERDRVSLRMAAWGKNELPDAAKKDLAAAQKKVTHTYDRMHGSGYFRDSYNATSVMWTLGLSWWEDVGKLTDPEGNLHPDNAKMLVEMIQRAQPLFEDLVALEAKLRKDQVTLDNGKNSVASWAKFFRQKRDRLVRFFQTAIKKNEPVYCSI